MLGNLKLTENPVHMQQPCPMSCVPSCLAMAFGVTPEEIIADMAELGIDISKGLTRRAECFYLSRKGVGSERVLNSNGLGLLDGHHLADVPSLNMSRYTHCIYLHVVNGQADIFDPVRGNGDLAFYDPDRFSELPIISVTTLDDFSDLIKATPPTEGDAA